MWWYIDISQFLLFFLLTVENWEALIWPLQTHTTETIISFSACFLLLYIESKWYLEASELHKNCIFKNDLIETSGCDNLNPVTQKCNNKLFFRHAKRGFWFDQAPLFSRSSIRFGSFPCSGFIICSLLTRSVWKRAWASSPIYNFMEIISTVELGSEMPSKCQKPPVKTAAKEQTVPLNTGNSLSF